VNRQKRLLLIRSQAVISAKPWFLWTLQVYTCFWTTIRRVLALTAISIWHSSDNNVVVAFICGTLAQSWHLYTKSPAGYDNDSVTLSLCKELTSTCASFPWIPSMSFSSSGNLRPCSRAWLQTDASSSNITSQFSLTNLAHHSQRVYESNFHPVAVTILVMYADNDGIRHKCEELVQEFERYVVMSMNPDADLDSLPFLRLYRRTLLWLLAFLSLFSMIIIFTYVFCSNMSYVVKRAKEMNINHR